MWMIAIIQSRHTSDLQGQQMFVSINTHSNEIVILCHGLYAGIILTNGLTIQVTVLNLV